MTSPAVVSQEKKRDNFIMLPNMTDDDLNIYEFRLLGHYTRVCGQEGGRCWQGIKTISEKTGMSLGMITKTRNSLQAKGYIAVSVPDGKSRNRGAAICVSLIDRWEENTQRYGKENGVVSQDEIADSQNDNQLLSHGEIAVSPGETNKINIKQEPESEKEKTTTALVPVANPEQDAPEPEKPGSGGGYVIPVLDSIDLWEFNARTLPAEIEPPARSFDFKAKASEVKPPAQSKPVNSAVSSAPPPVPPPPSPERKHNDFYLEAVHHAEQNKPDFEWKRVQEAFESVTGCTVGGTLTSLLNTGIALRGVDAVLELIDRARNAHTNRVGMVVKALKNWRNEPVPTKHKPQQRDIDLWFSQNAGG